MPPPRTLYPELPAELVEVFSAKLARTAPGYAPDQPVEWLEYLKERVALSPAEWDAFFDFCEQFGGDPVLAHAPKRGVVEYLLLLGYKERGRRLHDQPVKEIDPT